MNEKKLNVILYGIKIKINRGENVEDILNTYVKLTDEEKDYIRNNV